jgi:CelD/BcsL family acetyltransferase involved in cellulose biosynthesis
MRQSHLLTHSSAVTLAPTGPDLHRAAEGLRDRAVRLSVVGDLRSIEDEWRSFERRAECTPFQSFDWLANWQACIGDRTKVKPAIIVGRQAHGETSFILPLAIECASRLRRLVFLGGGLCDYNAPLLAPEFSLSESPEGWWRTIRDVIRQAPDCRYDLVFLDKMPQTVGRLPNPLCRLETRLNPSHAYQTGLGGDWGAFYTAKRSPHARRADGRKQRRLEEMGDIRFATAESADEIRETLNALFSQKSRSFARMGVPNLFARPGYAEFFISAATSAPGLVHVSQLEVGSECVAANLGLLLGESYYSVLLSHDDGPSYRHSPGNLHQHYLMRYAIAEGCKRFDFTIGDEPFKRDWADTVLQLHDHVAAASPLGKAAALWTVVRLTTKRAIKQSPRLWALATRIRSGIGSLTRFVAGSLGQGAGADSKVSSLTVDDDTKSLALTIASESSAQTGQGADDGHPRKTG